MMKLSLKNIGKIENASIEINGITSIAGENNTGKSTVGRTLFSVFNSFHDMDIKIKEERIRGVQNVINLIYQNTSSKRLVSYNTRRLAKDIINASEEFQDDMQTLEDMVIAYISRYDKSFEENVKKLNLEEWFSRLRNLMTIPEEDIFKAVLEKTMDIEFNGQINNIYSDKSGSIQLQIQDKTIDIRVHDNKVEDINESIPLFAEAIYLDDPFILDDNHALYYRGGVGVMDHKTHLKHKLLHSREEANIVEEIAVNNKLDTIYKKISQVCSGEIIMDNHATLGYQRKDSDKVLDIRNLSAGLKTFVILKELLQNGSIEYNGTIILDEPEIHLHPEWQLIFAELIVLLHKEFGMHILLNTHSPYFLRAIQVYSAKHEVADRCKYYLAELSGTNAVIHDVSDDVEKIYQKLSRPLQKLEDIMVS
ncbi:AAA family ATPase [Mediterraneibacter glycyrrhizinilyticus]|uniref:AAA family ATPase n=1 Tax=Mediterraneibacter glycyrrhizinilyticus TaxID=342942 RepID=UPI001960FEFA|nr:AAA family ATPase [Mediterraneibacter glycyrrhizinilyticus]MBM6751438.1 AAA family ATPase [Mediterraneibacter glycyrrhizinilyticus]